MTKIKSLTKMGLLAAGITLTGASMMDSHKRNIITSQDNPEETTIFAESQSIEKDEFQKRKPTKVYHRFEEIPSISDADAKYYDRQEYTYIADAEEYQKSGKLKLKRVLSAEVTKANTLSLVYRSECQTYNPRKNEDQLSKYVIDLHLINNSGSAKGPSQMDDDAIVAFIKYLGANKETRQYVLPLLRSSNNKLTENLDKLNTEFFDENNELRRTGSREVALITPAYKNIKLNTTAWQNIASPKLMAFINKKEQSMSAKVGRTIHLTNTTKNYLCLTELFPNEELLREQLENFNLGFYQLGRPGKTNTVTSELARNMNLKNAKGKYDATRLPTFVIATMISHINWQGNGLKARNEARNINKTFAQSSLSKRDVLRQVSKTLVTGKSRDFGIDELSKLNILTKEIIHQYTILELSGATELYKEYQKAVLTAEKNVHNTPKKVEQAKSTIMFPQNKNQR